MPPATDFKLTGFLAPANSLAGPDLPTSALEEDLLVGFAETITLDLAEVTSCFGLTLEVLATPTDFGLPVDWGAFTVCGAGITKAPRGTLP